jgi:WD40 repeat protein
LACAFYKSIFRVIISYNMNSIRKVLLITGFLLAGLSLTACESQLHSSNIDSISNPHAPPDENERSNHHPTSHSVTPTPTDIVPSQAGTALPVHAAAIAPDNARRLALFGQWGGGIPQGVAFNGDHVAVVSTRGLFLYDGRSLALERHIEPGMVLRSVAFAPDGSIAAGAEDGSILIYRTASGELLQTIAGHRGPVLSLAFSPDGERLASGGWDRSIRVWRWAEGRQLMSFDGHTSLPRSVSFSPDGDMLYSWGPDDHLRIWPLSGRNPPEPIYLGVDARRKSGSSAGFSGTGEIFAVDQDVRVRVIFTRSGNTRVMLSNFALPVEGVALDPVGGQVAAADRAGIQVWNGVSGQLMAEFTPPKGAWTGSLMAFSPDGTRLVSVGDAVRLWSLDSPGEAVASTPPIFQNGYRLFSRPDAIGESMVNGLSGGQLQPFRLSDGALLPLTGVHIDSLDAAAVSADGTMAAAAGADRSIQVWSTADGAPLAALSGALKPPVGLSFSPDGALLAAASGEELVRAWQVEDGILVAELEASGPVTQVSFSPDGAWLVGGSRLQTHLWRVDGWNLQETLPGRNLVFSDDSQRTARITDEGDRRQVVISALDGSQQVELDAQGSVLTFSPAADMLAVSGIDLSLYAVSTGERLFQVESPAPHGRVLFSPDARKLLLTAPDGVVYVYAVP